MTTVKRLVCPVCGLVQPKEPFWMNNPDPFSPCEGDLVSQPYDLCKGTEETCPYPGGVWPNEQEQL